MTTAAQVKKLVKPLLERHTDLALVGRLIVVKPVHHVLRGILIDRRRGKDDFSPRWSATQLFEPLRFFPLSLGLELYDSKYGGWAFSNPNAPTAVAPEIEQNALPQLRALDSLEKFVTFMASHKDYAYDKRPLEKVIVDVAVGNLDSARSICTDVIDRLSEATYGRDDEDRAQLARLKELCRRLAADDREGLARLLHEWEQQTVKNLKLEKLWEPTPFPLELASKR